MKTRMPTFYQPPLGVPFFWSEEMSGDLAKAVRAYLQNRINGRPITDAQIALVRDYMVYYINAPCWTAPASELQDLRLAACKLDSAEQIDKWIQKAVDIGIGPI